MFNSRKKLLAQLKTGSGRLKEDSFDFGKIERFFLLSDKSCCRQIISDRTFSDLDLGEIFKFIDRTTSKIGQQFLYHALRTIPGSSQRTENFENIIGNLKNDPTVCDEVMLELSALNKRDAYYVPSLFLEKYIPKPEWFWIIPVLSGLSVLLVLLTFVFPKVLFLLVLLLAVNFGFHYWNKINLFQYSGSMPELLKLNQAAKKIMILNGMNNAETDVRDGVRFIDSLGIKMSLFKLEVKLQSELGQAVEYLVELVKALFLIEPLVLYNVLNELDKNRAHVQRVYEYVGTIDAAMSIYFLREDLPYFCRPVVSSGRKQISAVDIYHPLIFDFVPNSLFLDEKSALLTGSNMSGKTTFIRTIGINSIVGQTINTCFAKEFASPALKIHSSIRISDDILSDKSYYFEEVITTKALLDESDSGSANLFLLDEMFKGTNTVERIASGKAVLQYLNRGANIVFVTSHDLELAELLDDTFATFHFTEIVEDGSIVFDYKIKPGNLTDTNAIRILALNNYPKEVIEEATRLANQIYAAKLNNKQ